MTFVMTRWLVEVLQKQFPDPDTKFFGGWNLATIGLSHFSHVVGYQYYFGKELIVA
jgi:hypothetical protein